MRLDHIEWHPKQLEHQVSPLLLSQTIKTDQKNQLRSPLSKIAAEISEPSLQDKLPLMSHMLWKIKTQCLATGRHDQAVTNARLSKCALKRLQVKLLHDKTPIYRSLHRPLHSPFQGTSESKSLEALCFFTWLFKQQTYPGRFPTSPSCFMCSRIFFIRIMHVRSLHATRAYSPLSN